MDDILASNSVKFKMLRAFWKLSFIKIDDDENKALMDVILRNNKNNITNHDSTDDIYNYKYHEQVKNKLKKGNYKLDINEILLTCYEEKQIKQEMALEASIINKISNGYKNTIKTIGNWDYISHQVIASPFKPIDYMDKIDIFGYKYIENFNTISDYLVIELKAKKAEVDNLYQLLKYVDWVNQEYTFGDYSMI